MMFQNFNRSLTEDCILCTQCLIPASRAVFFSSFICVHSVYANSLTKELRSLIADIAGIRKRQCVLEEQFDVDVLNDIGATLHDAQAAAYRLSWDKIRRQVEGSQFAGGKSLAAVVATRNTVDTAHTLRVDDISPGASGVTHLSEALGEWKHSISLLMAGINHGEDGRSTFLSSENPFEMLELKVLVSFQ